LGYIYYTFEYHDVYLKKYIKINGLINFFLIILFYDNRWGWFFVKDVKKAEGNL